MDENLNHEERELVRLVHYFKKRAERLITEKKVEDNYSQLIETCDKLVEQLSVHAKNRAVILGEREQLKNLVKDNARCPKCESNEHLKFSGTDVNEQGWKSNKYKCRRCNIEFVWTTPNNAWDMIPYVENFVAQMEEKLNHPEITDEEKLPTLEVIAQMKASIIKLKPVVEASDLDMADLDAREKEMADIVKKFKKHLMIEKIRTEE